MSNNPDLGPTGPAAIARPVRDAEFRGKITARQVASDPLEHWHAERRLSDRQYGAGCKLRRAMELSWRGAAVTAQAHYGSDESELDGAIPDDERDEDADTRRKRHNATWNAARLHLGIGWSVTSAACSGLIPAHSPLFPMVRAELEVLADFWGIER